jgi:exopolyphosphatase/guanosine-5'-triphosphate,3'-diphosphate pyrophosphatase
LKFAAIDIGSNAIRLLIEEVHIHNGQYHIEKVSLTRVPVRLGEDVFTIGEISKDKVSQLVKTMRAFWYLMDVHNIEYFRACATSAMREATNRKEVLIKIAKEANIKIDILTGDEEANLIFNNFITQNLSKSANFLYIDVGGGSTELTLINNGKRIKAKSFELGTVRMLTNAVKTSEWEKARKWIESSQIHNAKLTAIGTGGNINTVFKIQGKKPSEMLARKEILEQYNYLKTLSYDERITILKLKPDRADVILPACEIYLNLMEFANIREMLVPKIGLSDGIILEIFDKWKNSQKRPLKAVEL